MKKYISILVLICAALTLSSCIGRDVDWAPVDLRFHVQDKDGNDLLNPSSPSFIGDKIVLTYNGEDYMYTVETKTYMPNFHGFLIVKEMGTEKYLAEFGELNGGKNYDNDFVLTFPDGSVRTIHYDRKVNHVTVSAHQKWSLDGKKVESPILIVLK